MRELAKNAGTCENCGLMKKRGKSDFPNTLFSLGYYLNVKSHFLLLSMINKHTTSQKVLGIFTIYNLTWRAGCRLAWLTLSPQSLWIKASAKCPNCKWEYLSSHLVLFETLKHGSNLQKIEYNFCSFTKSICYNFCKNE